MLLAIAKPQTAMRPANTGDETFHESQKVDAGHLYHSARLFYRPKFGISIDLARTS